MGDVGKEMGGGGGVCVCVKSPYGQFSRQWFAEQEFNCCVGSRKTSTEDKARKRDN